MYLIDGTGKAWAWHVNAILSFIREWTERATTSNEKAGALDPTGSTEQNHIIKIK